jgi:glycolate oxidase
MSANLLGELATVLPPEALVTDADVLEAHRRDQSSWATAGLARVLVRPASTREVQAVLHLAINSAFDPLGILNPGKLL